MGAGRWRKRIWLVARIIGKPSGLEPHDASAQRVGHALVVGAEEHGRVGRQRVEHRWKVVNAGGVEAGVGLVEQHDVRFGQQGQGETQALLHAAGIVAHQAIGIGCKTHGA